MKGEAGISSDSWQSTASIPVCICLGLEGVAEELGRGACGEPACFLSDLWTETQLSLIK